ncbi:MAG: serine protease [Pirellulaceae bacterium]
MIHPVTSHRFLLSTLSVGNARCTAKLRTMILGSLVVCFLVAMGNTTLLAQADKAARTWSPERGNWQLPQPGVVRIMVDDGNATSYGSGTLVARTEKLSLVITNWHVVRDAKGEITVAFPDGFRSSANVVKKDRNWDLAALVIWSPKVEAVPIAQRAAKPGDRLAIAGYGSGKYRMTWGQCTQYVAPGLNFPYEMLELSVEARQGDSGGPIFNQNGELAGVLFGAGRGTTSGSYSGRVQQFLDPILQQLEPSQPSPGLLVNRQSTQPVSRSEGNPLPSATAELGNTLKDQVASQQEQPEKMDGSFDHGFGDQEPIPDPDQGPRKRDDLAQVTESSDEEAVVTQETAPGGTEALPGTTSTTDFRLVPVRANEGDPRFKMVPVNNPLGSEQVGKMTLQELVGTTMYEQIRSLLALVGLFYLGIFLTRRSE